MSDLGLFAVGQAIGQGAMGRVYRGIHRPSGEQVAIKVLTTSVDQAWAHADFRAEVRAAASLHHRHVVPVYDHGLVPASAEGPGMPSGAPYLVMALAEAGSLLPYLHALEWPSIATLLFQLLDALAHAHARGVVHCDLKPENVLLLSEQEGVAPALADFGIAHAFRRHDVEREGIQGTPQYMAPEQFVAQQQIGPASDLYALGCMAYELVCRRLPFRAQSLLAFGVAHTQDERPPLEPAFEVPEALGPWIHRLLRRDWRHRFAGAAEAAYALGRFAAPSRTTLPAAVNAAADATLIDMASYRTLPMAEAPDGELPALASLDLTERAPMPLTWRRTDPPATATLAGAGSGLFGLRPVPFVGREVERDRIWAALQTVNRQASPQAVLIRGEAGTGKSRLAEWMAQRADETGAGRFLAVRHGPVPAAAHGIAGLLHRLVRPSGKSEDLNRVCRLRGGRHVDAADGIILSLAEDGDAPFTGGRQHAVVLEWLSAMARPRPLILWVDDAQWGPDTLALVQTLLTGTTPALVLITVRDGEMSADATDRLRAISTAPNTETLDLAPLGQAAHTELVRRLLPLAPATVTHLVERTEGHPLFAVQLAGDWLARGQLQSGEHGLMLAAGAMADLPDNVHVLWAGRVALLTARFGAEAQVALELAATLGADVDAAEWRAVAADEALTADSVLSDALIRTGLARPSRDGWTFAHGLLRESILRLADEAGRLVSHHRTCGRVLRRRIADYGIAERVAAHALGAGDPAGAVDPLMQAASDAAERVHWTKIPALFAKLEALLDQLGAPPMDARRVRLGAIRIMPLFAAGESAKAIELLKTTEAAARSLDMRAELGVVVRISGVVARHEGRDDEALVLLHRAEEICAAAGEITQAGRAALGLVEILRRAGDFQGVSRAVNRSLEHFRAADDPFWIRTALGEKAQLLMHIGRLDEATDLFNEILEDALRPGDETNLARALMYLGQLERLRGNYQSARQHLVRSHQLFFRVGNMNHMVVDGELAMLSFMEGDEATAFSGAARSQTGLDATSFPWALPNNQLVRVVHLMRQGDSAGAEALLARTESQLSRPRASRSLAHDAAFVAERLAEEGFIDAARRAAGVAAREYRALGDDGAAEAIQIMVG